MKRTMAESLATGLGGERGLPGLQMTPEKVYLKTGYTGSLLMSGRPEIFREKTASGRRFPYSRRIVLSLSISVYSLFTHEIFVIKVVPTLM